MTIEILYRLEPHHIPDLCALYASTWWSQTRQLNEVETMLAHSDEVMGLLDHQTHRLVGFVRLLTDYTYRAVVFDVIVHPDYRDRGLGRQLMEAVIHHPKLRSVEAFLLGCKPDMVPFYEKFGFQTEADTIQLMVRATQPLDPAVTQD